MGAQQGKDSLPNKGHASNNANSSNRDLIHCNPRLATIGHGKNSQKSRSKDGLNCNTKLFIYSNG